MAREVIQIVEIKQPFCAHVFGTAPCTAIAGGDARCYNTRATCRDAENFEFGDPLSLWFTKRSFLPLLAEQRRIEVHSDDWIVGDGTWDDSKAWDDKAYWKDTNWGEIKATYPQAQVLISGQDYERPTTWQKLEDVAAIKAEFNID